MKKNDAYLAKVDIGVFFKFRSYFTIENRTKQKKRYGISWSDNTNKQ